MANSDSDLLAYFNRSSEEIRFFKLQIFVAGNAGVLLQVGLVSLFRQTALKELSVAPWITMMVSIALCFYTIYFIWTSVKAIAKERRRQVATMESLSPEIAAIHGRGRGDPSPPPCFESNWYDWKFFVPFWIIQLVTLAAVVGVIYWPVLPTLASPVLHPSGPETNQQDVPTNMSDWINAFYYTFTAISQVVAAIVAFSATFVIVRLSTFSSQMRSHCDHIIDLLDGKKGSDQHDTFRRRLTKFNRQHDNEGMFRELQQNQDLLKDVSGESIAADFDNKYRQRKSFLCSYKYLAMIGGILIIVPLCLLPFASHFAGMRYGCIILVLTLSLLAIYVVAMILLLAKRATES